MVNLTREPLLGEVEVDDRWVGGTQAGLLRVCAVAVNSETARLR